MMNLPGKPYGLFLATVVGPAAVYDAFSNHLQLVRF
jgi:hypothetical protein